MAGGLGLFLYGMTILSSGLEKASGGLMEKVLAKMTGNVPITKLMNLKRNCTTGALLSSSSGCRSTRIHS